MAPTPSSPRLAGSGMPMPSRLARLASLNVGVTVAEPQIPPFFVKCSSVWLPPASKPVVKVRVAPLIRVLNDTVLAALSPSLGCET